MLGLMQAQPLLISSIITHAARHHAEAEVVSRTAAGGLHRTTYAEVERRARRLARALAGLGVGRGDRVATLSGKSYAEYDVARADMAVRLPPELAGRPFPGEPIGCAMNIFRRSDVRAGDTVAIVGIGFLGAILTRLATDAGADCVFAFDASQVTILNWNIADFTSGNFVL